MEEDSIICQIMDMGFEDIEEIKSALVLAHEDVVEAVAILTNKQDTTSTRRANVSTKFDLGTGQMKPLKQWILEACVTTLKEEIEKLHLTRTVGIPSWTTMFGVELLWRQHHHYFTQCGLGKDGLKKATDRVINNWQKKPLTGMGDIGDTAPNMRPSREEGIDDDVHDAYTVELIKNVVELRGTLESDVKKVKDANAKKINRNNLSTSANDKDGGDEEGDGIQKRKVVGISLKGKAAGEARRDATDALGRPDKEPKRFKTSTNNEDTMDEAMKSLERLAKEREKREKDKMQFEIEEREYRRKEREEEKQEKLREREEAKKEREEKEKEKEKSLKEELEKSIDERFQQMRAEQERRAEDLKKFMSDLMKK